VKIKGTHTECGREFMVRQVLDSGGHCPWDGKPLDKDYTANLVTALREAEAAGSVLEGALQQIAGMKPDLVLDEDEILGPLRAVLERLRGARPVRA
jgi:hypothetical protein